MKRPRLLKREHGKYEQHAHFYTKKEATECRILIDKQIYPREDKYLIAMKRILTDREFIKLKKKYLRNNKRRKSKSNGGTK